MKLLNSIIFSIFILLNVAYAQISATAEIDKNEIRIGEPIELKLKLQLPNDALKNQIKWPIFKDTITQKIEIIDTFKIDYSKASVIEQKLRISVYDSGQFVLPPIKFVNAKDTTQYAITNTLIITVHTVPTDSSETSVKDIKPIFEEPFDIKWYMPLIIKILIGLLIVALVIYFLYRYFKKKPKKEEQDKPKLPPHIIALEKLQKIQQEELWKQGKIKEYYSDVADTIREYIEGRYKVPALEQTSQETLQALKFHAIDQTSREKLKYILNLSDLVKFAKFLPIESDHQNILQSAIDFVNETKLETISQNASTTNQVNPS
jgi:flagellar basal body-associated protein FliL